MTDVMITEIGDLDLWNEAIENAHHHLRDLKIDENRQQWNAIVLVHVNIDDQFHANGTDIARKLIRRQKQQR